MIRLPAVFVLLAAAFASACHRDVVPAPVSVSALPATPAPTPAPPPGPPAATAPGTVILAAGKPAAIASDATLTFNRIVSDSRCPSGAQCIWAGEVRISLALTVNNETSSFELSTMSNVKTRWRGFDFELLAFARCPTVDSATAGAECATVKAGVALSSKSGDIGFHDPPTKPAH